MAKPSSELSLRLSCCEEGDLQADSQFKVSVFFSVSPSSSIDVIRNYTQITSLLRELRSDNLKENSDFTSTESETATSISVPDTAIASVVNIEKHLNYLFATKTDLVEAPWSNVPLISFLDGVVPSTNFLTSSAFFFMTNKIKALDQETKKTHQMVAEINDQMRHLSTEVQSLRQAPSANQTTSTAPVNVNPGLTVALVNKQENNIENLKSTDEVPVVASNTDSNSGTQGKLSGEGSMSPLTTSPTASSVAVTHSTEACDTNLLAPAPSTEVSAAATNTPITTTLSNSSASKFNPTAPVFNPTNSNLSTDLPAGIPSTTTTTAATVTSASDELPSSSLLSNTIYQNINSNKVLSETTMDFVTSLCPQHAQVQYRDSVVGLIQRNFRLALNCEALEVGLHRLLCFLPDDPIKVSAVLCRNHATRWHRVICDRLNLIAKKRSEDSIAAHEGYTYRSSEHAAEEVDDSTGDHVIRNVLISNSKTSIHVQCSVDNTEVELSCNSRSEVCMLALLEEISTLVGKNDLFKHSLMLIRAWWCCESAAYVGTTVKNYLSDLALCTMVVSIFNMHHTELHTPLQALCAFLAEYSTYDGSTSAISIMGIVPFKSTSSNQPMLPAPINPVLLEPAAPTTTGTPIPAANDPSPAGKCLLSRDILERYWLLYCPPDPSNPEQQHMKVMPSLSSSSEDVMGYDARAIVNVHAVPAATTTTEQPNSSTSSNTSAGAGMTAGVDCSAAADIPSTTQSLEEAALSTHRQQCSRNMIKFDRCQFNIVDPFTCSNMVLERPSQNRIMRLSNVFQSGATQMTNLLTQLTSKSEASGEECQATLKAFFPMATLRFIDTSSRPDTFNMDSSQVSTAVLTQMTRRIPLNISLDELSRQMRYCNLMIESVISRTAILDLVVEILTQKGPLPIGEVGKALAELTCITGLSMRLKEAYGGLKKFLEDYASVVIIGTDHPFNPHIVLRSSLSTESLALNDSGVFPTHAVLKMKKITASSARKNAFAASNKPVPSMGSAPQHQGFRGGPPMAHGGGISMSSHTSDPRAQHRPINAYADPRMNNGGGGYGNTNNAPPQSYTAKFLSNLQADARDREQMQRTMLQQQQSQQQQKHHQQHHQHQSVSQQQHLHQQQTHFHHQHQQQPQYLPQSQHQHQQYQAQQSQDHLIRQSMERHGSATSSHSGGQPSNSYSNMFGQDSAGVTFISGTNSLASNSNDAFDEICNTAAANISPSSAYALQGQTRNTPQFFNESISGTAAVYDGQRLRGNAGGLEVGDQSPASRSRVSSYSSLYGGQVSRTQQPLSGYERSPHMEREHTPLSGSTNRFSNDSFFESSSHGGLDADLYGNNGAGGGLGKNPIQAGFPNNASSKIHLSPSQQYLQPHMYHGSENNMTEQQNARSRVGSLLSGLREGTVELQQLEAPRSDWEGIYPAHQSQQQQYDFRRNNQQEWI